MTETVEQLVRTFRIASAKVLRENRTPAKAREFLRKAGILVRDRKSPSGFRLAKRYR